MRPGSLLRKWDNLLFLVFILAVLFRLTWLIAFSVAVLVVFGIAQFWRDQSLKHIEYSRRWRYRRGFPGETLEAELRIRNNKLLPLSWVRVVDPWPLAVAPKDESILAPSHINDYGSLVNLYSLRWHETINRHYELLLRNRGVYLIGPPTLSSGDPFGMFDQQLEYPAEDILTVYPQILPSSELKFIAENPYGIARGNRRLFEDPNLPMGVREYHPDDEFRHVHWPATVRTGSIQVKVYQPVRSLDMIVCLNVSTSAQPWLGTDTDQLEYMIKVCATLIYHSIEAGYSVGLISNGCLSHSDRPFRILPGRSRQQLSTLLWALAAVTPYTSSPFENYLVKSSTNLPYGSTLIIVTSLVTARITDALIRLKRYRSHTTLISTDTIPPPEIPGINIYHLPLNA